jgi:hypothetical protein
MQHDNSNDEYIFARIADDVAHAATLEIDASGDVTMMVPNATDGRLIPVVVPRDHMACAGAIREQAEQRSYARARGPASVRLPQTEPCL